jgi:hypothetical protein
MLSVRGRGRLLAVVGTAALGAGLLVLPAQSASASGSSTPSPITYTTSSQTLTDLGTVNLAAVAGTPTGSSGSNTPGPTHPTPLGKVKAGGKVGKVISHGSFSIQKGNVNGAVGFPGITSTQQASVNYGGICPEFITGPCADLEPPDQGMCAGPDASGNPVVFDFINNAVSAYTPSGTTELSVTPSYALFNQPAPTFLSDPRCMYDSSTGRWFFTEFDVGLVSTQFVAVSQTSNPLGNYEVFAIDTTDASNSACPCFGDFDQIGADANGFYIATNEFPVFGGGEVQSIIYAISKPGLESAANGGSLPSVSRYAVSSDAFNNGPGNVPYHISPASTPQGGSYANNTEFFVESDSNLFSDSNLLVYSMTGTSALATGGFPALSAVETPSEPYGYPPNATQENGPIPLGSAFGATSPSPLQTDFPAVQEVTETNGNLYAELDTTIGNATVQNAGAAWFKFDVSSDGTNTSATLDKQGYVANNANLSYPDIVVDANGNGYMAFTLSGPNNFPTPAYVKFNANAGPISTIHTATEGVAPEDGFTCYYPACRWGDYSGGQAYNGRIYMGTEYIGNGDRDFYTNWQTYVWSAGS